VEENSGILFSPPSLPIAQQFVPQPESENVASSSSHVMRKGPGRPPKSQIDMELDIIIAQFTEEDPDKIDKMKKNKSSKVYRENKNKRLNEAVMTFEELQKEQVRLQEIYLKNKNLIKVGFKVLKRLAKKK
jgi:hypothetical protein